MLLEGPADIVAVWDSFNRVFAETYGEGSIHPQGGIIVQLFRLVATANGGQLTDMPRPPQPTGRPMEKTPRPAWWRDLGTVETPVYERGELPVGFETIGPALLEDVDTVVAVPPKWSYRLDEHRTGLLTRLDTLTRQDTLTDQDSLTTQDTLTRQEH